MSAPQSPTQQAERGAALVESVLLLSLLLIVTHGIALIGQFGSLQHQALQAARYTAWHSTLSAQPANASKLQALFFASRRDALNGTRKAGAPLNTWRSQVAGGSPSHSMRLQVDQEHVGINTSEIRVEGLHARTSNRGMRNLGRVFSFIGNSDWDLGESTHRQLSVEVPLQSHPWLGGLETCSEGTGSCLQVAAVSVQDDWSALNDEHSRRRTRRLVPSAVFESVGDALSTVAHVPLLREFRDIQGAFGYVDVNVLPDGTRR